MSYVLSEAIINCESGFNLYAQNPYSSAGGLWQFIDSTWETTMVEMGLPTTTSKFEYPVSLEAGVFLLKTGGVEHWECHNLQMI